MSFGTAVCNCGVPSTCAALCNTFGNMCQILDAVLERLQSSNKIHRGCYISKCQVNINAAVGKNGGGRFLGSGQQTDMVHSP